MIVPLITCLSMGECVAWGARNHDSDIDYMLINGRKCEVVSNVD